MPNIKSAKKRVKIAERNAELNTAHRSQMRTAMKNCRDLIKAGEQAKAQEQMNLVYKLVDRNVSKKFIHKRAGNRFKKRICRDFKAQFEKK